MSRPTTEMLDTYFEELSHSDKEAERTWFKAGIAAYCHLCSPASEGWKKEHGFMEDRTMKRDEQMMNAAEAYAEEVKATFTGSDEDKHQECLVAINDFCAGWREADSHPHWIPVEEELPKETGWYLVATPTLNSKVDVALWDGKWRRLVTITHWMPLPTPPVKKGDK